MKLFIFLIPYYLFLYTKTLKNFQYLQQNRYNRGNKYLLWLKSNKKRTFFALELLIFPIIIFSFFINIFPLVFSLFYLILLILYLYNKSKTTTKIPLKFTSRLKRLIITISLIYILIYICFYNFKIFYLIISLISYLNSFLVILVNYINTPIEKLINYYYQKKAQNKLKTMSNLKVIGITGSYGKTSSKNILTDILNVKYNAYATPKNYNTPSGLTITINDYLDKYNDFFITEMGACKVGEIKELCDLVKPTYGILTKIGIAHLETFKTQENIQNTKFELIESLPLNGLGILNADDELQINFQLKNKCPIIWIGIENKDLADIYATDIKNTKDGTTFTCHFKKEKSTVKFTTSLLGYANVYNILAGIALGSYLGLSKEELILGVAKVKPVEHRLELKPFYNMYLIDDAYNVNPEGAKMALDVLKLMPGEKIIVTSGLVELGNNSYQYDKDLGCYIAGICDKVILVGSNKTKPIYDGLISQKFKKENIIIFEDIFKTLDYLKQLNKPNTYILLQSDLPDIY